MEERQRPGKEGGNLRKTTVGISLKAAAPTLQSRAEKADAPLNSHGGPTRGAKRGLPKTPRSRRIVRSPRSVLSERGGNFGKLTAQPFIQHEAEFRRAEGKDAGEVVSGIANQLKQL